MTTTTSAAWIPFPFQRPSSLTHSASTDFNHFTHFTHSLTVTDCQSVSHFHTTTDSNLPPPPTTTNEFERMIPILKIYFHTVTLHCCLIETYRPLYGFTCLVKIDKHKCTVLFTTFKSCMQSVSARRGVGRAGRSLLPVHFPSLNIYIYIQYSTVFNTVNSEDTDKCHIQIHLPSSVDHSLMSKDIAIQAIGEVALCMYLYLALCVL